MTNENPAQEKHRRNSGISMEALLSAARLEALPLDQDPTARLLGLIAEVQPVLDGAALKLARSAGGLSASQLAGKLSSEGWPVKTADVFRWETRAASDVPVALILMIAQTLQKSVESLVKNGGQIFSSPRFVRATGFTNYLNAGPTCLTSASPPPDQPLNREFSPPCIAATVLMWSRRSRRSRRLLRCSKGGSVGEARGLGERRASASPCQREGALRPRSARNAEERPQAHGARDRRPKSDARRRGRLRRSVIPGRRHRSVRAVTVEQA